MLQPVQVVPSEPGTYLPEGQAVHTVAPAAEIYPAEHVPHEEELEEALKRPAAHVVQAVDPSAA